MRILKLERKSDLIKFIYWVRTSSGAEGETSIKSFAFDLYNEKKCLVMNHRCLSWLRHIHIGLTNKIYNGSAPISTKVCHLTSCNV